MAFTFISIFPPRISSFWPKIMFEKQEIELLWPNENKANDHTEQFISDEKPNSPNLFTRRP